MWIEWETTADHHPDHKVENFYDIQLSTGPTCGTDMARAQIREDEGPHVCQSCAVSINPRQMERLQNWPNIQASWMIPDSDVDIQVLNPIIIIYFI